MFSQPGALIPAALRFAPLNANAADALDVDRWMVDFEAAQRVGMGIEVALTGNLQSVIDDGLDQLIVIGARFEGAKASAQAFENALAGHYYTRGFDFVPQGTPTNNTETVRSPWQWETADTTAVYQRAWEPPAVVPDSHRDRFAQALGLDAGGITARAAHGEDADLPGMEAMNLALWYILWGEYLRFVLNDGTQAVLPDSSIDWLRNRFVNHVRGGAIYPTFQIGSMPYGILPIQLQPNPPDAQTGDEYLQWALVNLRAGWERSLPNVPHLDPTATASAADAPVTTDLEQESENLIALLSSQPHPAQFFTRRLNNLRTWILLSPWIDPIFIYEGLKDLLLSHMQTVDSAWGDSVAHDLLTPFDSLAAETDYYQDLLDEANSRVRRLSEPDRRDWEYLRRRDSAVGGGGGERARGFDFRLCAHPA